MSTLTDLYIEPIEFDDQELVSSEAVEAHKVRKAILALDGVARLYPRANAPEKFARAVTNAAAALRGTIENFIKPAADATDSGNESVDDLEMATHDSPQEKQLDASSRHRVNVFIRLGAQPDAVVPELAQEITRTVREVLGKNVAITLEVVNA